jgi:hypothetical protein
MMLNDLLETLVFPDGHTVNLNGLNTEDGSFSGSPYLTWASGWIMAFRSGPLRSTA